MKTVVVLAMHGSPPRDFPQHEVAEFFSLHSRLEHASGAESRLVQRHDELEAKMRAWPRTDENDPFWAGSRELGAALRRESGHQVIVAFNKFCSPSIPDAIDEAVGSAPDTVVVITPMLTRGGEHSGVEIPALVEQARQRHSGTTIEYLWPFDTREVARFLASQIRVKRAQ